MPAIDVQVHPFERDHPGRPWAGPSHGLDSATGDEMVAAMQAALSVTTVLVLTTSAQVAPAAFRPRRGS